MKYTFFRLFRVVFVIYSLYLMGDAFYRWDGYSLYGSFQSFIVAFALAWILWSFVALLSAICILLPLKVVGFICELAGIKDFSRHDILFGYSSLLMILSGLILMKGKNHFFPGLSTPFAIKIAVIVCLGTFILFMTWLFRRKLIKWEEVIYDRLTPLVILFSLWFFISIPIVAYQNWIKNSDYDKNLSSGEIDIASNRAHLSKNIILVTFDALSARHMSLYGYNRPTTPFIDKWAENAIVFKRAKAASNITAPTTASLISGKRVWTHRRYSMMPDSRPKIIDVGSLPYQLKKYGYTNMAFIVNPIATVEKLGVEKYFDISPHSYNFWILDSYSLKLEKILFSLFGKNIKLYNWILQEDFLLGKFLDKMKKDRTDTSFPPILAFKNFVSNISDNKKEPYFAWIHLNPPHSPYLPPKPFKGRFEKSSDMRTYKSIMSARTRIIKFLKRNGKFPPEINLLRSRYDEFIRYCDSQFEDFVNLLKDSRMLRNTIVILSSDHGENFYHNSLGHGSTLYESETHIPLIVKLPDQTKQVIINDIISQIDIPSTILDLAGVTIPDDMEGRSLVPLIKNHKLANRPVYSMTLLANDSDAPITNGSIAIWENDYKLIYNIGEKTSELYNLKIDPDEKNNLFNMKRDIGENLLKKILGNLSKANQSIVASTNHNDI